MDFNQHKELEGLHAFLGASKYHWINYSEDKLINTYRNHLATLKGTRLHEYAALAIRLGQRQSKSKKTLNMYINDAIGFKMIPEQVLYYSRYSFGTADAISFRQNFLRIHDLKTGITPAHMEQLLIYAALFCLEYKIDPTTIEIELRIYQSDDIVVHNPNADEILTLMDQIVLFDKLINDIRKVEV